MGFVRKAAKAVLPFGLVGNALLKDKKKKDKPQQGISLMTEGYSSGGPRETSSLVTRNY